MTRTLKKYSALFTTMHNNCGILRFWKVMMSGTIPSCEMGTWWPGATGEAAHPAVTSMGTWGSKCQSAIHVSLMAQVGLRVPTPRGTAPPAGY